MLGVKHDNIPALAFFRIDFENKIVFPDTLKFNKDNIVTFIDDYLTKPLVYVLEKYSDFQQKVRRNEIF
jgi:hypothetical protein